MPLLEIVLLAVLQGLTEFLPVSSSGHVVVAAALFDQIGHPITQKLTVNIVLHMGTLAAILVYYRWRIVELLGRDRRVLGLLVVGSLPAALAGLVLKRYCTPMLESPLTAGWMFPLTGAMLIWSARHQSGSLTCRELGYPAALRIGLFQALAILPGISRSGATIVAGLGSGLRRDEAAAFCFLLAIPVMAGAGLLEAVDLLNGTAPDTPAGQLALGGALSFLVGLAALAGLVRFLQQGRLHWFAWWVIPLGAAVLGWQFLSG
jgi:undecaprenyl-diphosphatase